MSDLFGARVGVLDYGYIEHVESWGSDERIVEAARMSTGKGFLGWGETCAECGFSRGEDHEVGCSRPERWKPGDEKLLRTLYENGHTSPFEMAGAVFEVSAPIAVFRQWHRHRTQSYNEMSARYVPLPDEDYVPTIERLLMGGGSNKQAQSTGAVLDADSARLAQSKMKKLYEHAQLVYDELLHMGVPKELARGVLTVHRYSRMRASANLLNWIRFLRLREDEHAQLEIRLYAEAIHTMLREKFPRTMELYEEERDG